MEKIANLPSVGRHDAPLHGIGAEFSTTEELRRAAEAMVAKGYRCFDIFSPFPVEGLEKLTKARRSPLAIIVFLGGLTGFTAALLLQLIPSAWIYPLMVAGRVLDSPSPVLVPILFEGTILGAALSAFFGYLILARIPRWNHPVFEWLEFSRASDDKFFLVIEARDPLFSVGEVVGFLEAQGGRGVTLLHET